VKGALVRLDVLPSLLLGYQSLDARKFSSLFVSANRAAACSEVFPDRHLPLPIVRHGETLRERVGQNQSRPQWQNRKAGIVEVDGAPGEHIPAEKDGAEGELSGGKGDGAAGEISHAKVEGAAGEVSAVKGDGSAGELSQLERDGAAGEHSLVECDGSAGEVRVCKFATLEGEPP